MTKAIIFPGGAGGNHLRWLMYLDSSTDTEKTIEQKIDFILNEVYSFKRSFYNWLGWEAQWRYDDKYESFIKIIHEPRDDKPDYKTIFLSFDNYDIPLHHYSVLTSCFSSETSYNQYYKFLRDFDRKIDLFIKKDDNQNKLILKADIFFNDELDKNFYETVIDFFELENHYEECCIIHNKWAECRKRVEQESHEFYTGTFWKSFLAKIEPAKIDVHTNKALLP